MDSDQFDPQRLLNLGCDLHREGRLTNNRDFQLIGGTMALMALQIQSDRVAVAKRPTRDALPVFAVLVLAWAAGLALGWYSGRPIEAGILLLGMGGLLAVAVLQAEGAFSRAKERDAWQKLKDMEAQWQREEPKGVGLE